MSKVPSIIRELTQSRKNQGITQVELANQINTSRLSIGNWENGKQSPTLNNVLLWAGALGYDLELFDIEYEDA